LVLHAILEYTPGTKKRVVLFNEQGRRIKGKENQAPAEIELAKAKVTWGDQTEGMATNGWWLTAPDKSRRGNTTSRLVQAGLSPNFFIILTRLVSRNNFSKIAVRIPAIIPIWVFNYYTHQTFAPIAQLDRASVYGTEGYWFESSWVYSLPDNDLRKIESGVK
jgi:hypothetical protein